MKKQVIFTSWLFIIFSFILSNHFLSINNFKIFNLNSKEITYINNYLNLNDSQLLLKNFNIKLPNSKIKVNSNKQFVKNSSKLYNPTRTRLSRGSSSPLTFNKNIKVQLLDWNLAKNIFKRNSVAIVTDVYTNKSFKVKRTMGDNHADTESLTKEDTRIIKSIWGGFSWNRRPVIVHINGIHLAASMSAMPHAGIDNAPPFHIVSNRSCGFGQGQNLDVIKNNDMDGHFDIHFLNSTRHMDGKQDFKHQQSILIAMKHYD